MKHEEFNLRYNEIMFDERDMIVDFLKKQADLRWGKQMYAWILSPMPTLIGTNGCEVKVDVIRLDSNKDLKFDVLFCNERETWECCNFAYNELSKILDVLPEPNDIIFNNAKEDLIAVCRNHRGCRYDFDENPFYYEVSGKPYRVCSVYLTESGHLAFEQEHSNDWEVGDFTYGELACLRDHVNVDILHKSEEYKKAFAFVSTQPNLHYTPANFGDVMFTIEGTDMNVDLISISLDSSDKMVLCVDNDAKETIYIGEKDIKPEYLAIILNHINKHSDIIDALNGHNKELVRKINAAWKDPKYHNMFSEILLALLVRDHEEYIEKFDEIDDYSGDWAMEHAHEIMYEICDDWDLETILSFIRYKEE